MILTVNCKIPRYENGSLGYVPSDAHMHEDTRRCCQAKSNKWDRTVHEYDLQTIWIIE